MSKSLWRLCRYGRVPFRECWGPPLPLLVASDGVGLGMIRIRLDEREFRDLVRGKVVRTGSSQEEEVELILADIGFYRMLAEVHEAMFEAGAYRGWRNERGGDP